jgi:fructose-bisphosphate aldolase class II
MALRNPKPWIDCAQREGFAVGAFNANTLEQVQGIVQAAQAEDAPVIVQVSHNALLYAGSGNATLGLKYMAAAGKIAAQSVVVPVALHLDHATESEVLQAIALGFTSVMFDGDGLTFEENVTITRRLCAIAHANGVCMEAEIGEVPKPGDDPTFDAATVELTDPDAAADFAAATGIDTLAVALGSVHGMKDKSIRLDLARLQAIRARVTIPLVLHGSSGVTDDDIRQGIALGLCKVNVATQLNKAFTRAVRAVLDADTALVDPRKYLGPARAAQIDAARERIRFIGAAGKAGAVKG